MSLRNAIVSAVVVVILTVGALTAFIVSKNTPTPSYPGTAQPSSQPIVEVDTP